MTETLQLLIQHGYAVLFLLVLIDQIGLPLPAVPVLLVAGALAGAGKFNVFAVILLAAGGSFLGHAVWYELGRRLGNAMLVLMCKISFEPDSCVRRTEDTFARFGRSSLLMSKFVPGLSAVAAPMAGMFEMPRLFFWMLNGLGAVVWAGSFIGLGYLFSDQLERVLNLALRLGGWLGAVLGAALIAYVGGKYFRRRLFLKSLRIARITPEELKRKLDAGEEATIIDLRHPLEFQVEPRKLPGAIRMTPEELERRYPEISSDQDVILYCT